MQQIQTLLFIKMFSLPKKRELVRDTEIEVVLVDATECEIERPKKNSGNTTQEKRKSTR